MSDLTIHPSTYNFLKSLARHNNREWFNAHKDQYQQALANAEGFMDSLIAMMNMHDAIETPTGKKSLYRIYNDVRFAKDKAPYTARFSGSLRRVKPRLRGGYYIRIKPGGSQVACGFSYPNPEDLKRIRLDIASNYEDWRRLLKVKSILNNFEPMQGEQVSTAPKGFPKDHPGIDLLRYKQFWFVHPFTDAEVLDKGFLKKVNLTYKAIRPFFDYMSEVLTTDVNGETLY